MNAVKEQQEHIERQQKQIDEQKLMIEGLRGVICAGNSKASVCALKEGGKDEN